MNPVDALARGSDRGASLAALVYRYWFFDWLFRDVNQGGLFERAASSRYNRERARWLPVYIRRWSALGALLLVLGYALEHYVPAGAQAMVFVPYALALAIDAVALAAWIGLRIVPRR